MAGTLNLGVLAHVDAGKTSLTERLLHAAGVIDVMGRVDDGTTQTDSLDLERRRGITIRAAVVSFVVGDVTVNLIDTPGHPDFIAEVDRVLGVLDGAVLVVSAVEGVQAQTGLLLRALRRRRVPALLFVNKIDRTGADPDRVLGEIADRLTPAIVPLTAARHAGTRSAEVVGCGLGPGVADAARRDHLVEVLVEVLAEQDEALLEAYLAGGPGSVTDVRLRRALVEQTRRMQVHPVYVGSAITGAGIDALVEGITTLLPAVVAPGGGGDGPPSGTVFKVERGPAGERIAYVRLFGGELRPRDRLRLDRGPEGQTVTALRVFDRGPARPAPVAGPGQIAQLWGLADVQVGDTFGPAGGQRRSPRTHFALPSLEAAIVPVRPEQKAALHTALVQLAEQDPLIALRQDDVRRELYVSLYGEVQKEVIRATLAEIYGIEVELRATTVVCVERPLGVGRALEVRGKGGNPFAATVGLRIAPGAVGSGLVVRSAVETGSIPAAFHTAVDEVTRATLRQGLHGWEVTDAVVTVTHCDHRPPPVPVAGFRHLTPLVAMAALARAGTVVCEPVHRFRIDLPADTLAGTYAALGGLDAVPQAQTARRTVVTIDGEIPAARLHQLQQQLPALTRGEGTLETELTAHRPVPGDPPSRPRTDLNPLHRNEYLLHLAHRLPQ